MDAIVRDISTARGFKQHPKLYKQAQVLIPNLFPDVCWTFYNPSTFLDDPCAGKYGIVCIIEKQPSGKERYTLYFKTPRGAIIQAYDKEELNFLEP